MKKVLVVMGSDSDLKVMEKCVDRLKSFDIPTEVRICSAHRTPAAAEQLAKNAAAEGFGVIIAAAGKAAHLGGVLAAVDGCFGEVYVVRIVGECCCAVVGGGRVDLEAVFIGVDEEGEAVDAFFI